MAKIIRTSAPLLRTGQTFKFGEDKQGVVRTLRILVTLEDGSEVFLPLHAAVDVIDDDPELCPNGQPWGTECKEIDPCEMCQQDLDEEGDKIEASMGLRADVVEDDEDGPDPYRKCSGCSGGCCTGGSDPCTC
jgi:hypothetical protein